MVWRAVRREHIASTIESESPVRDTVGDASQRRTQVERCRDVVVEALVSQHDAGELALAVRNPELGERRTVLGYLGHHACAIRERVDLHVRTVWAPSKCPLLDPYARASLR